MDCEPIPQDELDAARLRLKRKVAAVLIYGMADCGLSLEEMDARLGAKPGFVMRYLQRLVSGRTNDLNVVSDMALALNAEVTVRLEPYPQAIAAHADVPTPSPQETGSDGNS